MKDGCKDQTLLIYMKHNDHYNSDVNWIMSSSKIAITHITLSLLFIIDRFIVQDIFIIHTYIYIFFLISNFYYTYSTKESNYQWLILHLMSHNWKLATKASSLMPDVCGFNLTFTLPHYLPIYIWGMIICICVLIFHCWFMQMLLEHQDSGGLVEEPIWHLLTYLKRMSSISIRYLL